MRTACLIYDTKICGVTFPRGSVTIQGASNTWLVCTKIRTDRTVPLKCYLFNGIGWGIVMLQPHDPYAQALRDYSVHTQKQRKRKTVKDAEQYMEHDRKHKHGTGGVRLTPYSNRSITDYECSKNPLHDFPRRFR